MLKIKTGQQGSELKFLNGSVAWWIRILEQNGQLNTWIYLCDNNYAIDSILRFSVFTVYLFSKDYIKWKFKKCKCLKNQKL